jgi:hypothetical protein
MELHEFFSDNPEMIDGVVLNAASWAHGSTEKQRGEVARLAARLGNCTVHDSGSSSMYARVVSDAFAPHAITLYAEKVAVGHKVQDAIPEKWEWDALQS